MGCVSTMCERQTYAYALQQQSLIALFNQFYNLKHTFNNDFVIKAHKKLISNPNDFILLYPKKLQVKQYIPHPILEKWKVILYGTNSISLTYVSCLGFESQLDEDRTFSKTYHLKEQNPYQIRLEDLYFHESYKQIEKDAGRAFRVPQIKQDLFQKILKKIANHFPDTGYSLGINYIVGYFLIVGYSEIDSFWMFVHLALNPKYLAMGLFEDKFPLAQVLIQIFKNILRRINKKLHNYIYRSLQIMDQSWILKWLLSFYLSSFPIQLCQYVWDYTLTIGIVGLSIFAAGITQHLQSLIFKCQDQAEFSEIFRSFQNLDEFSQLIRMEILMKQIYSIHLKASDFDQIQNLPKTFYSEYFHQYFKRYLFSKSQVIMQKQQIERLDNWYQTILKKRAQFTQLAKTANSKLAIPKIQEQSLSQSKSEQKNNEKQFKEQAQQNLIEDQQQIKNQKQQQKNGQYKLGNQLSSPKYQKKIFQINGSIRKVKSQDLDQQKQKPTSEQNPIIKHLNTNTVKVNKSVRQIDNLSRQSDSPKKQGQINTLFKNISLLKRLSVQSGFSDKGELSVPKRQFKRSRSQSNLKHNATQQKLLTPHSFQKIIIDEPENQTKIQDQTEIKAVINQINQSKLSINFETARNQQFLGQSKLKEIFASSISNKINLEQEIQQKQAQKQKQAVSVKIESEQLLDEPTVNKEENNQKENIAEIKQIKENKSSQKNQELYNNKAGDLGISQLFLEVNQLQQKSQIAKIDQRIQINTIDIQQKKTQILVENQNIEQIKEKIENNALIKISELPKGQQHQIGFQKQTKE